MSKLIILAALLAATSVNAKPTVRVIDGDTLQVGNVSVRGVGFDTPETGRYAKCDQEFQLAAKAKARMQELVSPPHVFTMRWHKGKDQYGRGLAIFYSDHKPIGPILVAEGLAHPYDGHSAKLSWCN